MKLVDSYLNILQTEVGEFGGYANPVQTRPVAKPGVTGEDPKKELPPGVRGPAGAVVDLDKEEPLGYDFKNFAQADYGEGEGSGKKKKAKS